jgi:hypothetical protein
MYHDDTHIWKWSQDNVQFLSRGGEIWSEKVKSGAEEGHKNYAAHVARALDAEADAAGDAGC